MGKRQDNLWLRVKAAENKVSAGLKYVQFVGGRAVNSEDDLCIACVAWFDRTFGEQRKFDLIHIPNEGKRTRWEGRRLQRMGLRAGTPDYLLSKNGSPLCWIEFKFGKNRLTRDQAEFKRYAEAAGFGFEEVRTFDEFKQVLQKWGVYDPEKDKPKFFGAQQSQPQLDINKIFKRWRDE